MNKNLMEKRIHGEADFPISFYEQSFAADEEVLAPLHYHAEMEVLVAKRGKITVRFDGNEMELEEGEGLFINSSKLHAIYGKKGEEKAFTAVVFSDKLIAAKDDRIAVKYLECIKSGVLIVPERLSRELVRKYIDNIAGLMNKGNYGYEFGIKADIMKLFEELVKTADGKPMEKIPYKYQCVKQVLAYIEENYGERITLQKLADVAGLNREYFCRMFSEVAGETAFTYLNRYRIKKGIEYLKGIDMTVQKISGLCGFETASYFYKVCKQFEGKSPRQIREEVQGIQVP